MIDLKIKNERIRELQGIYNKGPQIGLVLGAGVTVKSGVPGYLELVLKLCRDVKNNNLFHKNTPSKALDFIIEQAELADKDFNKVSENMAINQITPEEIALFVRSYIADEQDFRNRFKKLLYENVSKRKRDMIAREEIKNNKTLNSILCFCADLCKSKLKPAKRPIEINPKVGGILTTNYDNLTESLFAKKFEKQLLKPVGRVESKEAYNKKDVIPVYHIHGYVSYKVADKAKGGEKFSKRLVIAEDDYFDVFYRPLDFGTYVAMWFLRRFPCLFIGSAMKDKNLRRFLYHLKQERGNYRGKPLYYAILKSSCSLKDSFEDSILQSYGVEAIWVECFNDIPEILEKVYTYKNKEKKNHWDILCQMYKR